ncbi:polyprenyl synthetase family protein [Gracilibacillus sp. S3-1-1]|uniref:Polyprenyl synthetase family protein n=1 Tax=Gracilibacillus pellucidus TaxID=3095368 RepID=A0ACC6M2Y1_9BACI|nr:polyprenyl synthetase family protein [Gracilibacillus sp. S3-1-1]MDX8045315.1 polyprenyl synthetase family protein [Gracilibacillus sp. S3-1-1]
MLDQQYQQAEQKARSYFQALVDQLAGQQFPKKLTEYLQTYQKNKKVSFWHYDHIAITKDQQFLQQLAKKGLLNDYLHRSISYIYLRDLGREFSTPETQVRIAHVAEGIKTALQHDTNQEWFNLAKLYRLAQKESLEATFLWLIDKLKHVSSLIPEGLDKVHAQRKLIKIIAGVLIHEIEELQGQMSLQLRRERLDKAVRIGYCYGLTYPFIDDLLDATILSTQEKEQFATLIRQTLKTGKITPFTAWTGNKRKVVEPIYRELTDAFRYLEKNQSSENLERFYQNAYLFFHAQEIDRDKQLEHPFYTNEELYIPVILKSSSSRMIVRTFQTFSTNDQAEEYMFYYGIYNQLADDLADIDQDMAMGNVTPYTYFLQHRSQRPDLLNPFAMYWSVISYLIHHVYQDDAKTRQIILDRAVNGLKRLQKRLGNRRFTELLHTFSVDPSFTACLQKVVARTKNVAFFDKLLRDQIVEAIKRQDKEKVTFQKTLEGARESVNQLLILPKAGGNTIEDAANYSLQGEAKRIRPIMTWVMATEVLNLEGKDVIPLLKAIEYMHTASLIFDDLPSQDNASMRRGRATVHEKYSSAVAELTALWMTQRAVQEQTKLRRYDADKILDLIAYSTQMTQEMCKGQIMDLEAKGKQLTIDDLTELCLYKTGIGFEAALMMPAIVAGARTEVIRAIKQFTHHAGIAFQIKDDLLDLEGDSVLLGKQAGIDQQNNSSTFVTVLGELQAKKEMWKHYCSAVEALEKFPNNVAFFKQLMDYIVHRER